MANNKLQTISGLICRILAYNICPKTDSYNYYSRDLTACVQAIMARQEVNQAKIMFYTIMKEHSIFFPYGAFFTHVFQKFKMDLASEANVVKLFGSFDQSVLFRMKLLENPSPRPTFPS